MVSQKHVRTGLVYHPLYLEHLTGAHPESPERLVSIVRGLEETGLLDAVVRVEPRHASDEDILRVHSAEHLARVRTAAARGVNMLDADTVLSEKSCEAATLAAGGLLEALDWIMEGKIDNALCLVRPPGHHATPDRAMGFCLFNNAAVAAAYLKDVHGVEKVLIVDWDLHHGNGTQDIFYSDPSVFYFSVHQSPHYPGTGSVTERGAGKGLGFTLNVPVPGGTGEEEYLEIFREALRDAAYAFSPDFVILSAGFDSHRDDPLGDLNMTEEGFASLTRFVLDIASDCSGGRLLSTLEGGYNLSALSGSVRAHLKELLSAIDGISPWS
jgi:acetoin utilization deacetylase AcuC-like enzyme